MKIPCLKVKILIEYENVNESKHSKEENVCKHVLVMLYFAM